VAFGITILSASYSHLLSGDGFLSLEPLVTFAALVISYLMRPTDRKFLDAAPGYADGIDRSPLVERALPAMRGSAR
jgi:hypothetical protein